MNIKIKYKSRKAIFTKRHENASLSQTITGTKDTYKNNEKGMDAHKIGGIAI